MQATKDSVKTGTEANPIKPGPPRSILREYLEMILMTGIQVLFLMTFIAQAMNVPTGSMQNTINIGDQFFVNKFIFGMPTTGLGRLLPQREPQRGDVAVFKLPKDPKVNYIKRVIGLPGETIQVKGKDVYINGQLLPEQHAFIQFGNPNASALQVLREEPAPAGAKWKTYLEAHRSDEAAEYLSPQQEFGVKTPYKIPEGHYFMMGDSRDNSLDSRYWGTVPRGNIIGRPLYVYWSFNPKDTEDPPSNWLTDFIRSIKWNRMGKAVK